MQRRVLDLTVGLFMLAGLLALLVLAFKVSGLTHIEEEGGYAITADFDNIGSLKPRAPVRIAGVKVGQVTAIDLDRETFRAHVKMTLNAEGKNIPKDSGAKILTEGILGSNYISLTPGFDTKALADGDEITTTHSALILENLLGQILFSLNKKS